MQNQELVKIIENLKGRRNYEEKKASKLGFASLYDYFEDKISKKQKAIEDEQKELENCVGLHESHLHNDNYEEERIINTNNIDFVHNENDLKEVIQFIRKPISGTKFFNPVSDTK